MPTLKDVLFLSGDLFLPKPVRSFLEHYWIGNDKSLVYVTNWSLVHFVSGIIVGWILLRYFAEYSYYWTAFWIHTFWEIWQVLVSNTPWWTLRGWVDVGMDTLLFMAGVWLVKV